jgi:hypothetical protein
MLTATIITNGSIGQLFRLARTCGWGMAASQSHNSMGKRTRQNIRRTNQHRSQQDRRTGMDIPEDEELRDDVDKNGNGHQIPDRAKRVF